MAAVVTLRFWQKQTPSNGSAVAAAASPQPLRNQATYPTMAREIKMLIFAAMLAAATCVELASHSGRALQQQLSDKVVGGDYITEGVRLLYLVLLNFVQDTTNEM